MNYRHIYHAGNFADIFKHAYLTVLLNFLTTKPKPLTYLETHAGCGMYDLQSTAALKTQEYQNGISKFLAAANPPAILHRYIDYVKALNPAALTLYPGSPAIAAHLLRHDDKLILCELHTEDAQTLKKFFLNSGGVAVHHCDGYQGLKAFTPPTPRRGLVLIDPPFEKTTEVTDLIGGLKQALTRWPNATYTIWYPIKNSTLHHTLLNQIKIIAPSYLNHDVIVDRDNSTTRLIGCGMIIINPPFNSENSLAELKRFLQITLQAPNAA